jgi:hypothetical protein
MQNAGIGGLGQPQLDPVVNEPVPGRGPLDGIQRNGGRRREPCPGRRLAPVPRDGGDPPAAHGEHLPPVHLIRGTGARAVSNLQADQDPVSRHQCLGHAGADAGRPAALVPGKDLGPVPARRYRVAGRPPPHARVQQLRVGVQVSCRQRPPGPPRQPLDGIRWPAHRPPPQDDRISACSRPTSTGNRITIRSAQATPPPGHKRQTPPWPTVHSRALRLSAMPADRRGPGERLAPPSGANGFLCAAGSESG